MEGEGDFGATFGIKTGQFTWNSVASFSHILGTWYWIQA